MTQHESIVENLRQKAGQEMFGKRACDAPDELREALIYCLVAMHMGESIGSAFTGCFDRLQTLQWEMAMRKAHNALFGD